ncbi:MAG TPA: hypothetical protein VJK52_02150, partial [Candidatus Nanoarchaeia archaeon]|nr:hypothetical protein [Candidatus Nanoarchaeia archaeon]
MSTDTTTIDRSSDQPYGVLAPEEVSRIPARPLGSLSDYVALQLPSAITAVRGGSTTITHTAKEFDALAEGIHDIEQLRGKDLALALFDATALASALRVLQSTTSADTPTPETPLLHELIKKLGRQRGLVPYLSYEGLIYSNPIDTDPRAFLGGDFGRQELLFYKLHALIEKEFLLQLPIVHKVIQARNATTDALPTDSVLGGLDALHSILSRVSTYMLEFHKLIANAKEGPFNAARPFWNATEKYQGPSGKFSAGYFLMDAVLSGRDPTMRKFLKSKLHELSYYPNTTLEDDGFAGQDDMLTVFSEVQRGHDMTTMTLELNDPSAN